MSPAERTDLPIKGLFDHGRHVLGAKRRHHWDALPPLGDHGTRYVEIWLDSGARADHTNWQQGR